MTTTWFDYFIDPILRAPTWGSILMGLSAGMIGVIVFLRKESLLGETLSHTAFPGAILGVILAAFLGLSEDSSALIILSLALCTALASVYLVHWLESYLKVPNDAALCFILAGAFGIGVTAASHIQFTQTALYRRMLSLLYGQAATMTDFHVGLYGGLSLILMLLFFLWRKEIQILTFDRTYAQSLGISIHKLESVLFLLIALTVIIGIRTVGIVLMSAMLIAPPVAARQFTHHLSKMFLLSGLFGMIAGFGGNYFSLEISQWLSYTYPGVRLSIPTGPAIVIMSSCLCLIALIAAPQRGLFSRGWRILRFRFRCLCENILKHLWRNYPNTGTSTHALSDFLNEGSLLTSIALWNLARHGWVQSTPEKIWFLTADGKAKAAKIVRLHRLWEVYLADYLGVGAERVHRSAEEIEHILTPDLEQALAKLLKDPHMDPHHQPIPPEKQWL